MARLLENAIEKQLACAAARSSSGLVRPFGSSTRDAHVVANGSIRGLDYRSFFAIENVVSSEVISFLLFALPELNTEAPSFTVDVTTHTQRAGEEVTPDIDAIGVLPRS